jgi:hypothetical protein
MKHRRGWECGFEIDLRRTEFERTGWIELAQERDFLSEYRGGCDVILASTKDADILASCMTVRVVYKIFWLISVGPKGPSGNTGVGIGLACLEALPCKAY